MHTLEKKKIIFIKENFYQRAKQIFKGQKSNKNNLSKSTISLTESLQRFNKVKPKEEKQRFTFRSKSD